MLTLGFEIDADKVAAAYSALGLDEPVCGANVLCYDEKDVVGILRMKFEGDCVLLDKFAFLQNVELGDKEFFVRASFFKLINAAPVLVKIRGEHEQLKQFGFTYADGCMSVLNKDITLCNGCHGKKE